MARETHEESPALLSEEELCRLRDAVIALHESNGGSTPHGSLVELAATTPGGATVTVDFQAAPALGLPLVVLQRAAEPEASPVLGALSPRERSVAELIAAGLANKEIAGKLGLSVLTVKDHVHRILEKTRLPNRAAVAATLRSSGG